MFPSFAENRKVQAPDESVNAILFTLTCMVSVNLHKLKTTRHNKVFAAVKLKTVVVTMFDETICVPSHLTKPAPALYSHATSTSMMSLPVI